MPADNYGTMAYVNGVWLTQCFTNSINQELEMDASGIDHVATKVTLSFNGLVTKTAFHGSGKLNMMEGDVQGPAVYSTVTMDQLLEKMNGTRKPFAYFIDNTPSFTSWPLENFNNRSAVSSTAARFGGSPAVNFDDWYPAVGTGGKVTCRVVKVFGDSSARVQVDVEYKYVPCDGGSTASYNRVQSSPVMSLRWWVSDDIDGNTWLQTRTYNGVIKLLNRNINPHFARYIVMPPLTKGYKRQSINYSESEDGTTLNFTVVDKEMFLQAPFPVTNFSGSWSVSQAIGLGGDSKAIIPSGQLSLNLSAPKNVSKRYLIGKMINMANTKLGILDRPGYNAGVSTAALGTFVTSMRFSENIHENSVGCQFSVMYRNPDISAAMWKIVDKTFGERESEYGEATNDGLNSDWTHEALYDGDDLSYLPGDKADFQYDPDTSIYEIPNTVSLAGLALCGLQQPCAPNIAFNRKLVVVEPQEEGENDNQQFDEGNPVSENNQQGKREETKANDHVVNDDPLAPYMEYDITETYREMSDVSAGSFSYVDDSTQRRNAGFHRQGRGRAVKDVTFSVTRNNKRPQIPGPYDYVEQAENGPIEIAVSDYAITNNSALPSASGNQVCYQVSGTFRGLMSRGYSQGESIRLATAPTLGDFGAEFPHDKTLFSRIPGENLLSFSDPLFNKQVSNGGLPTDPTDGGGDGGEPDGAV